MPQPRATSASKRAGAVRKTKSGGRGKTEARYSVGLPSALASQVERYAKTADASMSKAIAALVRIGLEAQASRKREFFKKLKENLAQDDPQEQDRLVDEFRDLILGR
jgi:hypothetical protein